MARGFSPEARKRAALARKIKTRCGEEAYLEFKEKGIVPPDLDDVTTVKATVTNSGPRQPLPSDPAEHPMSDVQLAETPADDSGMVTSAEPDDVLATLDVGEIVRDRTGQRIRIQKKIPGGLRVHDNRDGARDMTWDQLNSLGLTREERAEKGPAAQRLGELRDECHKLGIDTTGLTTKEELELALGAHLDGSETAIAQINPQLASDAKEMQDYSAEKPWQSLKMVKEFWSNDNWIAEEKLDGVRLKLHFTPEGVRVDSRRRDKKTRRFSEKTQNFPHLESLVVPELFGTVIDTEGVIPAESGVLPSGVKFRGFLAVSSAATNAGPGVSKQIQAEFGQMRFWAFDILRLKGEDVSQQPFEQRRLLLEQVLSELHSTVAGTESFLHVTKQAFGDEKLGFFEQIVADGGEGVIFKRKDAPYKEGKRDKSWQKLKKFSEVDAFVTGYIPGKAGNEGMVGAIELSVNIDGKIVPIAAVSQLTGEQRKEMTDSDGSLKPEFYNRVVTFRGQELTKKGRFRHAVFVGFREDKAASDIDGYEVRKDLAALGVI